MSRKLEYTNYTGSVHGKEISLCDKKMEGQYNVQDQQI